MKPTCHRCHRPAERSERFDVYFCGRCGLWLEAACGDPRCYFCEGRPPIPPRVAAADVTQTSNRS